VPTQRGSRPPHRFTAHAAARAVRSGLAGRRWRAHQERLATLPRRRPRVAPALGPVDSAGSRAQAMAIDLSKPYAPKLLGESLKKRS
jgi:hypothetical protein